MTDQTAVEKAVDTAQQVANNPDLQNELAKFVMEFIGSVKEGATWLSGQIPDVIQQLIHWNIAVNVFNIVTCLAIMVVLTRIFITGTTEERRKHAKSTHTETLFFTEYGSHNGMFVPLFLVVAITFFFLYFNCSELLQLVIAPKVWLM